jgi:hypothetical protein
VILPYILRLPTEDDKPFVYDTFLKIFRQVEPNNFRHHTEYFDTQRAIIDTLFEKSQILLACSPEDPNYLYGYIIFDMVKKFLKLHWLHIKDPFRGNGMALDILKTVYPSTLHDIIVCSHYSRVYKSLKNKYKLQYDPIKENK